MRLKSALLLLAAAMALQACQPGSVAAQADDPPDLRSASEAEIWPRANAAFFRNHDAPHTVYEPDETIPISAYLITALQNNEDWSDALADFRAQSGLSDDDARLFALTWIRISEITATCSNGGDQLQDRASAGFESCEETYPGDVTSMIRALAKRPEAVDFIYEIDRLQAEYGLEGALVSAVDFRPEGRAVLDAFIARSDGQALALEAVRRGLANFDDLPRNPVSQFCDPLRLAQLDMAAREAVIGLPERRAFVWDQTVALRICWAAPDARALIARELAADPDLFAGLSAIGLNVEPYEVPYYTPPNVYLTGFEFAAYLAEQYALAGERETALAIQAFAETRAEAAIDEARDERDRSRRVHRIANNLAFVSELIEPSLTAAEAFDAIWGLNDQQRLDAVSPGLKARFAQGHGYDDLVPVSNYSYWGENDPAFLGRAAEYSGIALVDFYAQSIAARDEARRAERDAITQANIADREVVQPQYSGPITPLADADPSLASCPAEQRSSAEWPGMTFDESFQVVRRSFNGTDWAVIGLSRWVDAPGEVSPGGYWVVRSQDGEWSDPHYLGFQTNFPWVIRQDSPLALICGERLVIAADRMEIDQASVSFPPIAMRLASRQSDIVLSVDWSQVEADRDGDGLTDIYEARLGLDPLRADTDADGLSDDVDPYPTLSAQIPDDATLDPAVSSLILSTVFNSGGTPIMGMISEDEGPLDIEAMIAAMRASPQLSTHADGVQWISGDLERLGSAAPLDRPVIVHDADAHARLVARYGPHYPVQISVTERDGGGAWYVNWSASWVGGSFVVLERNGQLETVPISSWIT